MVVSRKRGPYLVSTMDRLASMRLHDSQRNQNSAREFLGSSAISNDWRLKVVGSGLSGWWRSLAGLDG